MRKIRVLYKEPGKPARGVIAENTLDALRALVGGYLERVRTKNGIAIAYNEDAWALKLPDNCELAGVQFSQQKPKLSAPEATEIRAFCNLFACKVVLDCAKSLRKSSNFCQLGVQRILREQILRKARESGAKICDISNRFHAASHKICLLKRVQFGFLLATAPIFIAGYFGDRFADLPEEMAKKLRARYPKLWEEEKDG